MTPSLIYSAIFLAFLSAAAWLDLDSRRIPNALTMAALLGALVLRAPLGVAAVGSGLLGAAAAFAIAFPLFALGGFGGGDGKMLIAVGAFLGPQQLVTAALATALVGGVMAAFEVVRRKAIVSTAADLQFLMAGGLVGGNGAPRRTIRSSGSITIPYGVAIAIGGAAALVIR